MNVKLKRIRAEYEKNAARIARLQARQEVLEAKCTELENLEIVGMVRNIGMTPEQLAEMLATLPDAAEKQEVINEQ